MKKYVVKQYQVQSDKLNHMVGQLRILFISDFHNVPILEGLEEQIRSLKADLILIGGDIVVGKPGRTMEHAMELLRLLPKDVPVYAANGNHEYRLKIYPDTYGDMYRQYTEGLLEHGVTLLENESVILNWNGADLVINGYELPREYYARFYRGGLPLAEISDALPMRDDSAYQILLAHYPRYFAAYVRWRADLVLSGHYHGGVIRLGDYPVIGNDFSLFPKYGYGTFSRNRTTMVVSAGMGEHTLPLRVFNPRELVVVDLTGKRGTYGNTGKTSSI